MADQKAQLNKSDGRPSDRSETKRRLAKALRENLVKRKAKTAANDKTGDKEDNE